MYCKTILNTRANRNRVFKRVKVVFHPNVYKKLTQSIFQFILVGKDKITPVTECEFLEHKAPTVTVKQLCDKLDEIILDDFNTIHHETIKCIKDNCEMLLFEIEHKKDKDEIKKYFYELKSGLDELKEKLAL